MGTIAEKIQAALTSKTLIASAIEEKGGTVPEKFADYGQAIMDLETGGGGGGGGETIADEDTAVLFIDYDGTELQRYKIEDITGSDFELPALPNHSGDGLVSPSWNSNKLIIQTYVKEKFTIVVGACYETENLSTVIKISVPDSNYSTFRLNFNQTVASGVGVNWGDGTNEVFSSTGSSVKTHTYQPETFPSDYTITLTPASGQLIFDSNICGFSGDLTDAKEVYCSMIKDVKLGSVTLSGSDCFSDCGSMNSLLISKSVATSVTDSETDQNWFSGCKSIPAIVIPTSNVITAFPKNSFKDCFAVQYAAIPYRAINFESGSFDNCYSLKLISIPNLNANFKATFSGCVAAKRVCILNGNSGIVDNMFSNCYTLKSVYINGDIPSIGDNAFENCYCLKTIVNPSEINQEQNSEEVEENENE